MAQRFIMNYTKLITKLSDKKKSQIWVSYSKKEKNKAKINVIQKEFP